jgi:glycine/D-amino acid oxidase-like deaminating enzyme
MPLQRPIRLRYDAVVVGGGIVGCQLALALRRQGAKVVVLERESDLLARASSRNQARVHGGYHYPRSLLTAHRSQVNLSRFVAEYADCVEGGFEHFYAVARRSSKVAVSQFVSFCERIGAPLDAAPDTVQGLFAPALVSSVFRVQEPAFDAVRLRETLRRRLTAARVDLRTDCSAESVEATPLGLLVRAREGADELLLPAQQVFNCTYAGLNDLLLGSDLEPLQLRHELAELALVRLPEPLRELAVTVIDGPFFSAMPYPSAGLHSFSHVRYTPHAAWEGGTSRPELLARPPRSRFTHMLQDARRYLPALAGAEHVDSLWEVKTLLPASEVDDSRPFLFKRDHGLPGLTCVLGGKLDNVFDLVDELESAARELAA